MTFQIILLVLQHLLLPGYFMYSLWRGRERSRFQWILKVAYSGLYIFYIFLVGRWDWIGYYFRYLFPVLFVAAVYISYQRTRALTFFVEEKDRGDWFKMGEAGFVILLLLYFVASVIPGFFPSREAVRLAFPLDGGWYYIGQGGNSAPINQHYENHAQRFAIDILELNTAGLRAGGIYPSRLEAYVIFGETIYSPCDGEVVAAVDGLQDNIPPQRDQEHLAGNHVVIACQDVRVLLAHMKNGSIMAEEGIQVDTGQPLGLVGNSGNTTEPHLHIHAVEEGSGSVLEGMGVPIRLEGKFPVRNMLYIDGT